jgi:hypothetical protein
MKAAKIALVLYMVLVFQAGLTLMWLAALHQDGYIGSAWHMYTKYGLFIYVKPGDLMTAGMIIIVLGLAEAVFWGIGICIMHDIVKGKF